MESLGAVAGRVGHEINHLLLGILRNTEMAIEQLPAGSPACDPLGRARTAAARAAELSQQVLAYSGEDRLVVVPFDLSELVAEMRPLLELSLPPGIRLASNLGVNLPPAAADAVRIRHLLLGLLNGAEGGTVTLSTGTIDCDRRCLAEVFHEDRLRSGRFVYLEVADDGPAIPEPERAAGARLSGRALGLATALGIVRRYYGTLAVASGETGTTVKVILPAAIPANDAERLTLAAGWHDGGTALVIDGEEPALRAARRALERFGFDVVTAGDGRRGLAILRERGADVRFVVMDAGASEAEPGEVVRQIHELRAGLPVVVSDGTDPRQVGERLAGRGVAAVIRKPYRLADLRETIRGILESRG